MFSLGRYTIVLDVSCRKDEKYFILFHSDKKIYEVKDEKELSLIKKLESDMRWYDNELKDYLSKGYTLV